MEGGTDLSSRDGVGAPESRQDVAADAVPVEGRVDVRVNAHG